MAVILKSVTVVKIKRSLKNSSSPEIKETCQVKATHDSLWDSVTGHRDIWQHLSGTGGLDGSKVSLIISWL